MPEKSPDQPPEPNPFSDLETAEILKRLFPDAKKRYLLTSAEMKDALQKEAERLKEKQKEIEESFNGQ